jgi:hypothetical protein
MKRGKTELKILHKGQGCSSVVEYLLSICEALGLTFSSTIGERDRERESERERWREGDEEERRGGGGIRGRGRKRKKEKKEKKEEEEGERKKEGRKEREERKRKKERNILHGNNPGRRNITILIPCHWFVGHSLLVTCALSLSLHCPLVPPSDPISPGYLYRVGQALPPKSGALEIITTAH